MHGKAALDGLVGVDSGGRHGLLREPCPSSSSPGLHRSQYRPCWQSGCHFPRSRYNCTDTKSTIMAKKQHLYLEIAESIRRRIASGELGPGDRLPSVRRMAQRCNCTPGTVSRAYTTLAQDGLIEGFRGGGTRVTPNTLLPEQPVWRWIVGFRLSRSASLSTVL